MKNRGHHHFHGIFSIYSLQPINIFLPLMEISTRLFIVPDIVLEVAQGDTKAKPVLTATEEMRLKVCY